MTTLDWILGYTSLTLLAAMFLGLLWCVWWGVKHQPYGDDGDRGGREEALERLKRIVCDEFEVEVSVLAARDKRRVANDPRMVFCYLCVKYFRMRIVELSELVCRDRSTVMHAVRRAEDLIDAKDQLGDRIRRIENKFLTKPI